MRRLLRFRKTQFHNAVGADFSCTSMRWSTGTGDSPAQLAAYEGVVRNRYFKSGHVAPLTADNVRASARICSRFITPINCRAFIDSLGITSHPSRHSWDAEKENSALVMSLEKLCPAISAFIYDMGVPLALEQLTELLVPSIVFAEDALCGRPSKGTVLLLDDADLSSSDSPGHTFHQPGLSICDAEASDGVIAEWYLSGDMHSIPSNVSERVEVITNEAFDVYFDSLLKAISEVGAAAGLYVSMDSDGRPYVMPGSSEFFLRRLYPCVRKDSFKSLWHVCLSAGWTGFGRSRMSDVEVLESYFDHISNTMGPNCPVEFIRSDLANGAGDGSVLARRRQDDHVLPSVNELARYNPLLAIPTVSPLSPVAGDSTEAAMSSAAFSPLSVPASSPLHRLHTEVVLPQAQRMRTRGLSTLMAFLESEKMLLDKYEEKSPFALIALATRLSTPSFVLEILASCPAKRAKDPTLGPLPSWCFPLYAGYFVGGDDMRGIAEMHVRSAVKTVLNYDTSDNDVDSLRNACLDLKSQLFQHHAHLSGMHAHVLLCSFRFMQKHEQLHRALKKSIVAVDDAGVRGSRIKEIIGNVLNSLTELEYCISANLMHIPTKPLVPGRVLREEEPEELKLAKADALYQYWYLDWLASNC